MSAKKRVYDKDLGVELVVDEETDEELANNNRKNEQNDQADRSKKKAKFDFSQPSQSSSNQRSQQPKSQVLSVNSPTSSQLERDDWPSSKLDPDSESENYEDIDYGDDDYDDFNSDNQKEQQSEDSKSQSTRQDDPSEDDEHDDGTALKDILAEMEDLQDESERRDLELFDKVEEDDKHLADKCKYWPICNAGDECTYYHPTKRCRAFPCCKFGHDCRYKHPPCKYNPNCTRPHCPFAHPLSKPKQFKPVTLPPAPECKYGFNCTNLMCKFSHQRSEPCRFGANCLLDTCAYTHPKDAVKKKQTSAFKWSAQP